MGKTAFVFAGQGSQYIGMGKDFYENYPEVREIYKKASDITGYDLYDLCINGDIAKLSQTKYAQVAIFALSMAGFEILKNKGIKPDCVAGFSLGEISALCASGYYSLEDGFKLVNKRASSMQKAAEENGGAMYAVLNVSSEDIIKECEKVSGYAVAVNFNSPVQTVIAGDEEALSKVTEALIKYDKAKCIKLNVNSAFHSKFMLSAAENFYNEISDIEFKEGIIPVYSDITSDLLKTNDLRSYLKEQIISPVKWVDIIRNMIADGVDTFIELGSGKTLCGLIKKTDRNVKCINVENMETLKNLESERN